MTLFLLAWPEAMVTEDRGTFKSFAKNSMQAALALGRRSGQGQFQRIAQFASDGILFRSRVNFYGEGDSTGVFVDQKHNSLQSHSQRQREKPSQRKTVMDSSVSLWLIFCSFPEDRRPHTHASRPFLDRHFKVV